MMHKINVPSLDSLVLAYETGAHIGDGCCHATNYSITYTGNLETDYDYFSNVIFNMLYELYGITPKIIRVPAEKTIQVRICSKNLFLFKTGMLGLPSGSKSVMKEL